jgi:hypothetical protein
MTTRVIVSLAVAVALSALVAWLFAWPLERAVYLAPALVLGAGLVAAVGMLLARALLESLRASRNPRLVLWLWVAAIVVIVILSVLGFELPRGE